MRKSFILFIVCGAFLVSCNGKKQQDNIKVPEDILNQGINEISEQAMQKIIDNVSSPVEIAALIKNMGIPFSKNYLAPTDYVSSYNTNLQKALALGIYGSDLGYLNMYNKTGTVLENLSTIRDLSNDLKVGQFFDFSTIKRLATNKTNLDSLMYISVHSFNEMDKYLRSNKRGNLSALMVAGVWLEGLYLITQVEKTTNDKQLSEKIGEQKIMMDNLILILRNYENDASFKPYLEDFEKIKKEFAEVKITYELGEPEAIEKDGKLMIIQHEKSIVHISDEVLKKIIMLTEEVRNKLIKS